ncbi:MULTISPECIES: DUF4268 domain-containing protein [Rhodococcus]|uniref:DUF4268 domain-containing protein n=1 Tax=Rhodococcus TaxID=1827 RepID=UPI000C7CE35E|nr:MULTISPECIES: DUF4268 domain-containing protein [Rhodococcus]AUM16936.1 DUF4268 domain-containing protein [Rhodococcus ruber]MBD8057157.1 DUF4268 domain-containing protein [Rhodococcus ruber]MCF8782591.1 DUF4268 domain-containing protein [Rhodococcus ruber]
MELDGKNLGRLRRVADPRSVWTSEAGDFTPWLAENIDVLAEELEMPLTVVATQVAVGEFWLDIQAEDDTGRTIIVENQLERTDHGHLGQSLVYAAGLDAAAVVWIAARFREDHRSALDWLNEHTDSSLGFFGVEVGVVQISDTGPRAPVFQVVSRPNDWQKSVKSTSTAEGQTVSSVNAARQDFFAQVLTEVNAGRPAIRVPARSRYNWLSFAFGPFGSWGIAVAADGRLRLEAYIDMGDRELNKQLFGRFADEQTTWESKVGHGPFSWERLEDKRASRIALYHPIDLNDDQLRDEAATWAVNALTAMYDALNEPLRTTATKVRAAAATRRDEAAVAETETMRS